jgi:hypothetical protein
MKAWNELVRRGRVVELEPPTASDIAQRIRLAHLAAEESEMPGLRPSRRFQILYEAAYRWCDIVLRAEAWRTKGEGHHETLFSALPHFLGDSTKKLARFLDRCRRRRNIVTYGIESPPVTENHADELASVVETLESLIIKWLQEKHSELLTG